MQLEKDEEVWIRVKVKDNAQHKEGVWGVVLVDHLSSLPQEHNMFIHEDDIVTDEDAKFAFDFTVHDEDKIDTVLEELFHEINEMKEKDKIQCRVNTEFDGRLSTLEQDLPQAEIRALDAQERVGGVEKFHKQWPIDYMQVCERLGQLERDIETHNTVITRIQKTITPGESFMSSIVEEWASKECPECSHFEFNPRANYCSHCGYWLWHPPSPLPTTVDNVCRVCDRPIPEGQVYCRDHAVEIRTGEEVINSMEDLYRATTFPRTSRRSF